MNGIELPITVGGDGQQSADSVEKVGFLKLTKKRSMKTSFSALLREISVRMALRKFWISISDAYFSTVEAKGDFFNRIGQKWPVKKPIIGS